MRNLVVRKLFQGEEVGEGQNEMEEVKMYSGNIYADYRDQQREKEVKDTIKVECPKCEGKGYIENPHYNDWGFDKISCYKCSGTGRIIKISESEAKENAEIRAGELKEDR